MPAWRYGERAVFHRVEASTQATTLSLKCCQRIPIGWFNCLMTLVFPGAHSTGRKGKCCAEQHDC